MSLTLKKFKKLIEAYGTEVNRWPPELRDQVLALLKTSAEAEEIFKAASKLDAALAEIPAPAPADKAYLKRLATIPFASRSLGEEAPTTFGEFMKGFFPARKFIPQGIGIAALGALGLWLGFAVNGGVTKTVVEIDPTEYFLGNSDLEKDLEDLR